MNADELQDALGKSPEAVVAADVLNDFIIAAEEHLEDQATRSRTEDDDLAVSPCRRLDLTARPDHRNDR